MTPRELIEEYKAFLGVYRARISRAHQVRREYEAMRAPLIETQLRIERELSSLEYERDNADDVISEYEAKLEDTTRVIAKLEGEGTRRIMGSGEGTRPRKKKPGRLSKLLRLQRKLTTLLEEDPDLAEYLDTMEEA